MRICLITENFYPDWDAAVSILLSQLVRYLHDKYSDMEIDVVTSSNLSNYQSRLECFEQWQGVRIFRVNAPVSKRPSTVKRLLAGIYFSWLAMRKVEYLHTQKGYDLICLGTNPPTSPLVGRRMFERFKVPYLYIVHDLFPDAATSLGVLHGDSLIVRIARRFQQRWLDEAKAVVVVGRCMHTRIIQRYRLNSEKVRVITNWCDPSANVLQSKETAFRSAHKLSGFLVIYAGNVGYNQKLGTVLNAAKRLQCSYPDIAFVLIGRGNAWGDLESRISDENIKNVHLFPAVTQIEYFDVLASADISLVSLDPVLSGLAVPSKFYNILAAGRPIIAIMDKNSEISQMLREYECGIQVDHDGDGVQLTNAILALHDANKSRISEMRRQAHLAVTETCTLKIIAEQYYQLFHELVG